MRIHAAPGSRGRRANPTECRRARRRGARGLRGGGRGDRRPWRRARGQVATSGAHAVRARALAISNDPLAEEAAQAQLAQGGSAVGAVLAGFFAAAGGYSGVLLSPLSILVAGIGTGGRAFDGRLRQPGLGTKRPRGFLPDEAIPIAARVAVPAGVAAAAVANAYDGAKSLGSMVKHGILRAER